MSEWSAELDLALTIADAADQVTMGHYLSRDLRVDTKPDRTPVTEADQAAEQTIRQLLTEHRPGDQILGEEFGTEDSDSDRRWIIDPIDGTANYLRGVPIWCTSSLSKWPVSRWWSRIGTGTGPALVGRGGCRRLYPRRRRLAARFTPAASPTWPTPRSRSPTARLGRARRRSRATGPDREVLAHPGLRRLPVHDAGGGRAIDIAAEPYLAPWDMAALAPIITESGGSMTAFDGSDPLTGLSAVTTSGHFA